MNFLDNLQVLFFVIFCIFVSDVPLMSLIQKTSPDLDLDPIKFGPGSRAVGLKGDV